MAEQEKVSKLVGKLAEVMDIEPGRYWAAVKKVAGCGGESDEDFLVLLHLADKYGLDPLRKEVCMIKTKAGPRPYVGIDGWLRIMTSQPDYDAHDIQEVWSGGAKGKGTIEYSTAILHSKKRKALGLLPFEHTEYFRECVVRADYTPWNSHPSRMLKEKALIQGVRLLWNIYIPDIDEWDKMDSEMVRAGVAPADGAPVNLTPAIVLPRGRMIDAKAVEAAPEIPASVAEVIDLTSASRGTPAVVPQRGIAVPEATPAAIDAAHQGGMFDDLI